MVSQQLVYERTKALNEANKPALARVLVFTALSIWLAVAVLDLLLPTMPQSILILWAAIQAVCLISYALRGRAERLAAYVLALGLWLCVVWASRSLTIYAVFLFSAVHLIVVVLLNRRAAFMLALASSGYILSGDPAWALGVAGVMALATLWYTLLTSFVLVSNLYHILDISWHYQTYAVEQMEQARTHRGELMRLTKALQEAKNDLENVNIQLRYARQAAEEARRLKAQFAANVSHELRTPINLIVGFSEMIATAPAVYRAPLPGAYSADVNAIYRNAKHLQGLINDVLDVSQIEAGQMTVMREPTDPRQVILEVASLVRDHIVSRKLDFQVELPDTLPMMLLDRIRIRQTILNLLSNAIRFTDQGQITLRAFLQPETDSLRIVVADTGIGIQPADLDKVFEEFQQSDGSLSRRYGGSGLGLTLSKHFVELHGGTITVSSDGVAGHGSTFTITLPLDTTRAFVVPSLPRAMPEDNQKVFVLYDEDPSIARLFERYTVHHKAIWASAPAEVDRLLSAVQPSALVMDSEQQDTITIQSNMPPTIRCTMPSGRRRMQHAGVTDYLVKPVTQDEMKRALDRLAKPVHSILVIDDDPEIVRLFSRILSSIAPASEVWKAYGGREGLALLEQLQPDLVILDWLMPDVGGQMIVEAIQQSPTLCNTAVIVASAQGAVEALAVSEQGSLTVEKPGGFQPIELVRCVESLVESFRPAVAPAP